MFAATDASVYVVVLAGRVAMSAKPDRDWRLRLTTSFFSVPELSTHARVMLLDEMLVAVRFVGGLKAAHAFDPTNKNKLTMAKNGVLKTRLVEFRTEDCLINELAVAVTSIVLNVRLPVRPLLTVYPQDFL